jgi:hypothetical protein
LMRIAGCNHEAPEASPYYPPPLQSIFAWGLSWSRFRFRVSAKGMSCIDPPLRWGYVSPP